MSLTILLVSDEPTRRSNMPAYPLNWLEILGPYQYDTINSNRFGQLRRAHLHAGPIIALGAKAQKRLSKAGIKFIALPHPSALNNTKVIAELLEKAKIELNNWVGDFNEGFEGL